MARADEKERGELEDKIRELEEQIRRLEEGKAKGKVSEGTTAGILKELGSVLPGLDKLISGLEKSEAFRERLKAIDEELEARLRDQPLKRVEKGERGPSFQPHVPGRPAARRPPPRKRRAAKAEREVVASKEPPVDVFDEETHLRVIAELPGIADNDIRVELRGARLAISADTPVRKYHTELVLPYAPQGRAERLYQNGILELTWWKE